MPLSTTVVHEGLVSRFLDALKSKPERGRSWDEHLRSSVGIDGFEAVLDDRVRSTVLESSQSTSFDEWVLGIREWLMRLWDPRSEPQQEAILLSIVWEQYARSLAAALRIGRVTAGIPERGGVLGFVGGLQKCLVLRYEFAGVTPRFDAVAVIDQPRSAFDFWGTIESATGRARNELKSILASGHKLIYHRGVLTHVDRRVDAGVFGPSIDTLVMSELLARALYEGPCEPVRSVLEVGCGSGLLSCNIAQHLSSLEELYCVDVNAQSIACTERNLKVATLRSGMKRENVCLVIGTFEPYLFNRGFDLIICNPPYIPLPPKDLLGKRAQFQYFAAVGGTELLEMLLSTSPTLLNPGGRMLLMLSSLCLEEAMALIPAGFAAEFPFGSDGFEVAFDVDDVLAIPEWLDHLQRDGNRLKMKLDGGLTHRLHPMWLERVSQ
jgi:release factor glutamine methyltransferase